MLFDFFFKNCLAAIKSISFFVFSPIKLLAQKPTNFSAFYHENYLGVSEYIF